MKIKWQDCVSNKRIYVISNQGPWSKAIKQRRWSWFGHLARLPVETPVRQAFEEYRPVRKPKA